MIVGKGIYNDGVIYDDATRCITSEIRITPNTPITYIAESNHSGIYGISFYDSDHNIISGIANNALNRDDVCFVYAPLNTYWVRLSIKVDQIDLFFISQSELIFKPEKYAVVSASGSDSTAVGNGSFARPFASVGKALQMGFRKILMAGGYYDEVINLNNIYDTIELAAYEPGKAPVFRPSGSLITTTETKASGYNKVYYCSYTGSFDASMKWIFQDGYADRSTVINEAERLPLERGLEYRCNDTLILKCTETTLASALDEIDADTGYKWFFDENNDRLYYSRPASVSNINPIRKSTTQTLFTNNHTGVSLKLTGINAKYMAINLNQSCNSVIADCRVENAYNAGAFTYDNCVNIQFIRCEASRCDNGLTGDGFNGHGYNDYDKHTKTVTATFVDCWSHDNNDDGYSDHEFSETTIIGGLYEFNGKGGVTPSYGSHCTCYNVISRYNKNGFYCVGDVSESEGGKYTQLLCFDCFAFGNNSRAGYRVDGANNRVILHNCTARNNIDGYRCESGCKMDLFDCRAYGNDNTLADFGNGITIRNNEIVTNE